jgi:hypothetical protein
VCERLCGPCLFLAPVSVANFWFPSVSLCWHIMSVCGQVGASPLSHPPG